MTAPTDAPPWERYPNHPMDEDSVALYEGWLVRELRLPRCRRCNRWHTPPRSLCPFCWSDDLTFTPLSGRGTVHLSMVLHVGPPAPVVEYPYPLVTVELEEQPGLRFTSTVVDGDADPVVIGSAVELVWIDRAGAPFPAFRTTSGGNA
ncbi:Zn-ribbon domain-containing OB-fold protein [Pseudonocardia sp. GCM10023141]|uniref:Zn-ribbon domain-containing OB-fold protein n=1 Tax=Pseudonocardia sp. GCM10023141 TaxID=3252653 RepID=UPI0036193EE5